MNFFKRGQSLNRCLTGKSWFGQGLFHFFSKVFGVGPVVGFPLLRSAAATSDLPARCLFFLFGRLEVPSPPSASRFLPLSKRLKIALTASSPAAWLEAMSRSSLVVTGLLRPSL